MSKVTDNVFDKFCQKHEITDNDLKSFLKTWDGVGDVSQSYQQWMVANGKATTTFANFTQKASGILKGFGAMLDSMAINWAICEVIKEYRKKATKL